MAAGEKRLGVNLVAVFVFFFLFFSVYGRLTGATVTFYLLLLQLLLLVITH